MPDGPLLWQLLRYRMRLDRDEVTALPDWANLVSSRTTSGKQMPILDLDFPHAVIDSSTPGHKHLYLDREISNWRWVALMIGLRLAHVIEPGFFIWSMRRRGNFVRLPGLPKQELEQVKPTYGWLFRLR